MQKSISINETTHAKLNELRKTIPGAYTPAKKETFDTVIVRLLAGQGPAEGKD